MLVLIQKMVGKPRLLTHWTAHLLMPFLPEVFHDMINALMINLLFSCLENSSHANKRKTNNLRNNATGEIRSIHTNISKPFMWMSHAKVSMQKNN